MDSVYVETVRLLLDTAPVVFREPDFAMKGGTAINLFVQAMPRLSVDIDVVYTDHSKPREEALAAIASALARVREGLLARGVEVEFPSGGMEASKLFVRRGRSLVKVEVNHVFRGTVLEVETLPLVEEAQNAFSAEIALPVLSVAKLYGSKLVAALDRQHPRDLFDVRGMFQRGGLSDVIVECFVCYLAGHNRPVHEVLLARKYDVSAAFENEFRGMTREAIEMDALLATRDRLWKDLPATLTSHHREFLLSLVRGEPDWNLSRCKHLEHLPAIQWKLRNLVRLKETDAAKFVDQERLLTERFERFG